MVSHVRQLEAAELNIGKLLTSGDFEFVIPEYQRPYAWGKEQAYQLIIDLMDALDRDIEEPYFLGSIVLVKSPNAPKAEVIDGQQRITTLLILLALLRDLATNDNLKKSIHELIEKPAIEWDDQPARPRLKLRSRDHQFFEKYVQTPGETMKLIELSDNKPKTDSQKALRDNAKTIYNQLIELDSNRQKDLFRLIAARAVLVTVSTSDLNSAYRIFSVMNSRGLPLAPQDIFKSQVIGAIPEESKQQYADQWEQLEEVLGRKEFGDLFLYIRAIKTRVRGEKSLLQEFKEHILEHYLPNNGIGFIEEVLDPYAHADLQLLSQNFTGDDPRWEQVNHWIKRLDQLDNDDWRPPALWAITRHGEEPEFLINFLIKLERLAASMLVRRVYATPRQIRYKELIKQLIEGQGLEAAAFELSDVEKSDTRLHLNGDIYLDKRVRRYLLPRLDSTIADNPGAIYNHRIITVEHVLPQNPGSDSQWVKDFSKEEIVQWTHKLGNLLLLNRRTNSRAQNYDFDTKKEKYFKSDKGGAVFALTTQVLAEPVWTPEVIERRQTKLVEILTKEWRL